MRKRRDSKVAEKVKEKSADFAFPFGQERMPPPSPSLEGEIDRNNRSFGHFYVLTFVFELLFMVVGSMVVAFFSRLREYRADRGSASLVGKEKMIAALQKLEKGKEAPLSKSMNAFMISMPSRRGLLHLFATHPPIQARIARLKHSF